MKCPDIQNSVVPYLELDMDPTLAQQVSVHLETCLECRTEMECVRQVLVRIKRQAVPDPGEKFWREFAENVRWNLARSQGEEGPVKELLPGIKSTSCPSKPLSWRALVASLALVVALGLVGGWFFNGNETAVMVQRSPVLQQSNWDPPDLTDADIERDWGGEDPDMVLAELAAGLDRQTLDVLFKGI